MHCGRRRRPPVRRTRSRGRTPRRPGDGSSLPQGPPSRRSRRARGPWRRLPESPGRSWTTRRSSGSPSGLITTAPRTSSPSTTYHARSRPGLERQRSERGPRLVDGDRRADEEQPSENVEPVAGPGGADQRSELTGGQVGEHVRPETFGDGGEGVAGVIERPTSAADVIRAANDRTCSISGDVRPTA